MNDRYAGIKLFLQVIVTIGVLATFASVFTAQKALQATHEWNRRHYTTEILRTFPEDTFEYARPLIKQWPGLRNTDKLTPLAPGQARDLWQASAEQDSIIELRQSIVGILNYMEFVCKAYEENIVDRDAIKETFSGLFTNVYVLFQSFIGASQQDVKGGHWQSIGKVVESWGLIQRADKLLVKPPTG